MRITIFQAPGSVTTITVILLSQNSGGTIPAHTPVSILASCVTLGELHDLSEPQCPRLKMGIAPTSQGSLKN